MSTHVVVLIEVRPPSWHWPRKATLSSGKGRASCGSAKTASSMAAKRLLNRGEARPLSSRRAEVARRRVTWRLGAMEACARLAHNAALRGAWRVAAKAVHTVTTRPSNSSLALRMSGNKAINFNACGQTGPQGSKATHSTILPLTSHSVQSSHEDSHSSSLVLRTRQLSCHGGVIALTGDTPTRSESIKMYVDKKLRPTLTSEAAKNATGEGRNEGNALDDEPHHQRLTWLQSCGLSLHVCQTHVREISLLSNGCAKLFWDLGSVIRVQCLQPQSQCDFDDWRRPRPLNRRLRILSEGDSKA